MITGFWYIKDSGEIFHKLTQWDKGLKSSKYLMIFIIRSSQLLYNLRVFPEMLKWFSSKLANIWVLETMYVTRFV